MVMLDVAYAIKDAIGYAIEIRDLQMTKKENKTSAETLCMSLRSIQQDLHEISSELTITDIMKEVFTKIKHDVNVMNADIQPFIIRIRNRKNSLLQARSIADELRKASLTVHLINGRLDTLRSNIDLGRKFCEAFEKLKSSEREVSSSSCTANEINDVNIVTKAIENMQIQTVNVCTTMHASSSSSAQGLGSSASASQSILLFEGLPKAAEALSKKLATSGVTSERMKTLINTIHQLWSGWQLPVSNLQFEKRNGFPVELGRGGAGVVYSAKYKYVAEDETNKKIKVAVKSIELKKNSLGKDTAHVLQEMFLHMSLSSHFIVRTFGACWPENVPLTKDGDDDSSVAIETGKLGEIDAKHDDTDDDEEDEDGDDDEIERKNNVDSRIHIVMEYMSHNLYTALDKGLISTDEDSMKIVIDICNGLMYLHGRNIVHRDLKPQNVLLRYKKGCLIGHAKLADFGCSRIVKGDQSFSMSFNKETPQTAIAGTPMYLPPEVLFSAEQTSRVCKSWDIWAVGMIICHIFASTSIPGQTLAINRDEHISIIHKWASQIENVGVKRAALSCLTSVSSSRPTIKELRELLLRSNKNIDVDEIYIEAVKLLYGNDGEKDERRGISLLQDAFECGHIPTTVMMAACYAIGKGVTVDDARAIDLFESASNAGNADAMCALAYRFANGFFAKTTVTRHAKPLQGSGEGSSSLLVYNLPLTYAYEVECNVDDDCAVEWFKRAADAGSHDAKCEIGFRHLIGWGVAMDPARAFQLYRTTSEEGCPKATFNLGLCYANGWGVKVDQAKAVALYQQSSDAGYVEAMIALGHRLETGGNISKDVAMAVRLYWKARDGGSVQARFHLNRCYSNGLGTAAEDHVAVIALQQASDNDDADAIEKLAYHYREGRGAEQDLALSFRLYQKASEQGHHEATHNLACCFAFGWGTKASVARAVELWRDIAKVGSSNAMLELGFQYLKGEGLEKNIDRAAALCRKASAGGCNAATYNLANCYEDGWGVDADYRRAIELYRRACEGGNADAMCQLGNCYFEGRGVEKNVRQAVQFYERSSDGGSGPGTCNLALRYELGEGVQKNKERAIELYTKAVQLGFEAASSHLREFLGDSKL